ncbi:hypothetical protein T11_4926 [Trichinella zimbabwensis]|uniref:Uncharacterized protein n=1 Tax=Trichinella zimbabwensis TaxID=268475 RepID=A0A0V1HYB8_9BILA|nr:hypothetical protein T11_4926 [Trichinella zimbabwensis]
MDQLEKQAARNAWKKEEDEDDDDEEEEEIEEKKKLTRFGITSKDESENRCTTIDLDGKLLDITIHIHSSVINEKVPFA